METIFYLVISLLFATLSFLVLYSSPYSEIRIFYWLMFYISMSVVAVIWLNFFFPEMPWDGTISGLSLSLSFRGKFCLASWVASGFFFWVYLRHKDSDFSLDKITKLFSKIVTIAFLALIVVVSLGSWGIKLAAENKTVVVLSQDIPQFDNEVSSVIEANTVIPVGGSLCGTLGITKQSARKLAKLNNLKYYYRGNKLIVLVHPGSEFMRIGIFWMPVKKQIKK